MKLTSKDIDWEEGAVCAVVYKGCMGASDSLEAQYSKMHEVSFDGESELEYMFNVGLAGKFYAARYYYIVEREQVKLRLDYLLDRGVKTAIGDKFFTVIAFSSETEDAVTIMNKCSPENKDVLITSFSPRKNAGCLPVPEDVPVLIFCDDKPDVSTKTLAGRVNWTCQCFSSVVKWMPDIDELIKQQIAHDAKNDGVAYKYLEIPNTITVKDDMDLTDIKPAKVPADIENIKVKVAEAIDKTKADKQLAELVFKGSINRQVRDLGDAMNHFAHSTNEEAINMLTTAITRCKEIISEMAK